MSIETKRFRTWNAFKSEFSNFLPGRSDSLQQPRFADYLFRGQMDAAWGLGTSFDRAVPLAVTDRTKEFLRWHRFFRYLHRHLGDSLDGLDEFEIDALAQHYGAPTRLLDWSLSPYIAAFFAFFDSLRFHQKDTREVAIWALHIPSFRAQAGDAFRLRAAVGPKNFRIRNQLGKFLINNSSFASLDDYVEKANSALGDALIKLVIPASQRVIALNDLLLMGISPIDIYPDHEGIAMYVKLRQALDGYQFG
jgi:FRG domain